MFRTAASPQGRRYGQHCIRPRSGTGCPDRRPDRPRRRLYEQSCRSRRTDDLGRHRTGRARVRLCRRHARDVAQHRGRNLPQAILARAPARRGREAVSGACERAVRHRGQHGSGDRGHVSPAVAERPEPAGFALSGYLHRWRDRRADAGRARQLPAAPRRSRGRCPDRGGLFAARRAVHRDQRGAARQRDIHLWLARPDGRDGEGRFK